jgi:hypothetical protein
MVVLGNVVAGVFADEADGILLMKLRISFVWMSADVKCTFESEMSLFQ